MNQVADLQIENGILHEGVISQATKRVRSRLPQASQLKNIRAAHLRKIRVEVAKLCIKTGSSCTMMVWTPTLPGWKRPHLSAFGLGPLQTSFASVTA
jgi:hypothetical protein